MLDLALIGFVALFLVLGLKRPFFWVLAYIYIDIVSPQKVGWGVIQSLPLSLIAFAAAFGGWLLLDNKQGSRFTFRQALIAMLLLYCGATTLYAAFPVEAATKWSWVWKALVFAIFLPLALRTRLRIEAAALIMVLSLGTILINGGIKTLLGGGGYGTLTTLVTENVGIYEGSTLSTAAIAFIPLVMWVARHGTIFPARKWTLLFGLGITFAALLIPVGTQTRTGLLCIAALAVLCLRTVKYRFVYAGLAGVALLIALPFLPASYTQRMSTIGDHQADQSASTRVAVWRWTLDYAKENPFGGGFDSFLANSFTYNTRQEVRTGNTVEVVTGEVTDKGRAFHSAYFELLGEQGWPGLFLWLWIQAIGLWQMERVRRLLRASENPQDRSWRSLATALQNAQAVCLIGAVFVGVAYQPFIFMLISLQIALATQVFRQERDRRSSETRFRLRRPQVPVTAAGGLPA
jgi:probable O-glycosylation ligase (exosortase A-associated)